MTLPTAATALSRRIPTRWMDLVGDGRQHWAVERKRMANLDALQRGTLAADNLHRQVVAGEMPDLVSGSLKLGEAVLQERSRDFLKAHGQFLTPAPVARFMARQLGPLRD